MHMTTFTHDGAKLVGHVATPAGVGSAPVVLVFPSALGVGGHVLTATQRLADAGYLGIGVDMYGDGLYSDRDGAAEAIGGHFERLLKSPELLRNRALAWVEHARGLPGADPARIAAIGYCFGGHCVLELARAGADLKAVASFHGLLATQLPAAPGGIRAEIAAYCGDRDPYAPVAAIEDLSRELIAAGARHQITVFHGVEHGFTDPDAAKTDRPGISYDQGAERVSWAGTLALLGTVLA